MNNKLAAALLSVLLIFIIVDAIIDINKIVSNIVYGIMGLAGIYHLLSQKKENGLDDIFKKKE